MARGINKVIIVGNCCADPDMKYTASGAAIANISVATNEQWTDKQSGQKQERTEFHRVVMFNRLGEIAGEYLKKGSQVYIEGKLQTRKWQDQNGQDRYTTEIVANEMQMLGGGQGQQNSQQQRQAPVQQQYQTPQYQSSQQQQQAPQQQGGGFSDFDDKIPFARMHMMQGG